MSATTTSAPFSQAVVRAMKRLYPQALADNSWDNTGLLLEAPFVPTRRQSNKVLLTVDLTKAVADEAIALQASIIVAYHPIIFRGLKSLTFANSQQQTLLRLASHGISVYSPHTAVDSAPGGLGDWMADIVTAKKRILVEKYSDDSNPRPKPSSEGGLYTLSHYPSKFNMRPASAEMPTAPHTRRPIVPQSPELESHPGAGMGRIVQFNEPQPLATVLERIGRYFGKPKGIPIAIPQNTKISDLTISSIGICAGSGASLLANLDVDLLVTGEMSHHEALAAIEKGQSVISLFHSNSERGFLNDVLKGQLENAVTEEWDKACEDAAQQEALGAKGFEVFVSDADRDPYGIAIVNYEWDN